MSRKQLGMAVINGYALKVVFSENLSMTAYLAGMDDYHYFLVRPMLEEPFFEEGLVHKAKPCAVMIDRHFNLDNESEVLRSVCQPFRDFCIRSYANGSKQ